MMTFQEFKNQAAAIVSQAWPEASVSVTDKSATHGFWAIDMCIGSRHYQLGLLPDEVEEAGLRESLEVAVDRSKRKQAVLEQKR